ncbi:MAG: hypothetical protein ABI576_06035 [Flavobacterium sp.]
MKNNQNKNYGQDSSDLPNLAADSRENSNSDNNPLYNPDDDFEEDSDMDDADLDDTELNDLDTDDERNDLE